MVKFIVIYDEKKKTVKLQNSIDLKARTQFRLNKEYECENGKFHERLVTDSGTPKTAR